jgi:hypothetical protein
MRGKVENVESDAFGVRRCEKPSLQLRFRSRWANGQGCAVGFAGECPWGPSWGETATDSEGRFSKLSLYFADKGRRRDVLIEFKRLGLWSTLTVLEDFYGGTPHQTQGNTWVFDVGTIETSGLGCPTVLTDAGNEDTGGGGLDPIPNGSIALAPCGLGPNGKPVIDLAIVSAEVRHRDNSPNSPPERVSWEVTIRNNGVATYRGTGNCRTQVRAVFNIVELDQHRSYEMNLNGEIAPGQSRTFTSNSGNLGELSDEQSSSYNVLFTVDPENKVLETNEGNNQQQGCYTPATETYVQGPCPTASQSSSKRRGGEKRRKPSKPRPSKPRKKQASNSGRSVLRNQ